MAKRHRHTTACLGAWETCPGLSYVEWVRLAGESGNPKVWRDHELIARYNLALDDPTYRDLGGEA